MIFFRVRDGVVAQKDDLQLVSDARIVVHDIRDGVDNLIISFAMK